MEKPRTKHHDLTELIHKTIRSSKIPDTVGTVLNFHENKAVADIDPEQIRMALKNIIRNAVQAMKDAGKLTISVRAKAPEPVEITISDTGPGIPPENLEKLFEPLFTTKVHGIGFGLSITKMIIENHGGTIRAESEPGGGARFTIILPQTREMQSEVSS